MKSLSRFVAVALLAAKGTRSISASPLRSAPDEENQHHQITNSDRIPDFLAEQTNRLLQDEAFGQNLGQRCGRNTECIDTLECNNGALLKRCLPPEDCLQQRLSEFEQRYGDMEDYKTLVLESAGTSPRELVELIRQSNQQGRFNASTSGLFQSVADAIHQNMAEPMQELRAIMRECGVTPTTSSNSTDPNSDTQDSPPVDFVGYHLEGGLLLEVSLSYIDARTPATGYQKTYFRWCLGLQLGGGAEFSFLFGQYPQGSDVAILNGGSFYTGVDIGLGFHFGGGGGVNFQGIGYFEIAVGVGVGIGIGGSLCYAFESTWQGGTFPFPIPFPPCDDP